MRRYSLVFVIIGLFLGCQSETGRNAISMRDDLSQIRGRGNLVAITGYSATTYFVHRGQPMGYEYELLEMLAEYLDVDLEIVIADDMDKIFGMLNNGEGDVVAHSMAVTKQRKEVVSFTKPLMNVSMVLIQRKPDDWRKMKYHEIEKTLIRNPIDLIGKKVHVRKNSSYYARLVNLSEEIGGDIDVETVSGNHSTEELIKKVSRGQIQYTVADENIAMINKSYYRNIDIKTQISLPQQIAWAVRKKSPELLKTINRWIELMEDSTEYYVIYNKYFKNRSAFIRRAKSEFTSVSGGALSPYDNTIKRHAERIGWDWRLLASMIYQESQFDPNALSWAGAVGIMQLMPKTAEEFGAEDLYNPQQNIKAGVNYLMWLDDYWQDEIPDKKERQKFILGSYNVGYNHIQDARRLASKYGARQNEWEDNVAEFLIKKSIKKYYNDEVVEFGYCRGEEPVNYVSEILERRRHYVKLIEDEVVSVDE